MSSEKKIVLTMIVKNEAHVIERCLASTLPVIDTWVIVDTGSTDGTQDKIKQFFDQVGIPGKLVERPWVDFATNRSEALELARPEGAYSLMIDADEILEFEASFDADTFKNSLTDDLYQVFAQYGGVKYHRPQLTGTHKKFYYRGVLHEYVECDDQPYSRGFVSGFINRPIQDGARSKNPEKYKLDAELLEKTLASGNVDQREFNRYHYYLAQSYRDAGMFEKAYEAFLKRASLGGWEEEVFYSLYQAGAMSQHLAKPVDETIRLFTQAFQANPWRAEPLFAAARLCRIYGRFDQAYRFAAMGVKLKFPNGALFVSEPVYTWLILDEYAQACYWTDRVMEAKKAGDKLLAIPSIPEAEKKRMEHQHKVAISTLLNPE